MSQKKHLQCNRKLTQKVIIITRVYDTYFFFLDDEWNDVVLCVVCIYVKNTHP